MGANSSVFTRITAFVGALFSIVVTNIRSRIFWNELSPRLAKAYRVIPTDIRPEFQAKDGNPVVIFVINNSLENANFSMNIEYLNSYLGIFEIYIFCPMNNIGANENKCIDYSGLRD